MSRCADYTGVTLPNGIRLIEAGTRLGPYEVGNALGAGGMGEVYKGRDTRLDRSVAIKVLASHLSANSDFRQRFEREARVISSLNHPNICTLFDVGENYLVMELLEGESLATRLERGPLPVSEVLRYGAEIAAALDRAHRAGIVHRDLKPANIMLTKSGAKLLDFGLAKPSSPVQTDGATVQKALTQEGMILGTYQYMAPEQLEAGEADARGDIFAFGCVLYEMTTGIRAFEGKTRTSLIAAIVSTDPRPIREVQPLTPPALEHVIQRCLEKDPERRWQSAHDVAEELRWISHGSGASGVIPVKRARRSGVIAGLAALAVIATMAAFWLALRPQPERATIEAAIEPVGNAGPSFYSGPPALSPDGKNLVYAATDVAVARPFLWSRSLDREGTRKIAGTEGAMNPAWSPDGRQWAFIAGGKLKTVDVTGGEPEIVTVAEASSGVSWNREGLILHTISPTGPIHRVRAEGGESVAVTDLAIGKDRSHRWPYFLPDGRRFLYLAQPLDPAQKPHIVLASLDEPKKRQRITEADSNAVYAEPGHLFFVRDGVLRVQRFDASKETFVGNPSTVGPVQGFNWNDASLFTVGGNSLLYQRQGSVQLSELLLRKRTGETVATFGEPAYYWSPSISADGKSVAVDRSELKSGDGDIWIMERDRLTRVTFDARNETNPIWSPDGRELLYMMSTPTGAIIHRMSARGGSSQKLLVVDGTPAFPSDWSRDGRFIALERAGATPRSDVFLYSLHDEKTFDIAATPFTESGGQFSPDGRWITYQSNASGRHEIYVQPVPPDGRTYQVSADGGSHPRWRRPGEIVYVSPASRFMTVGVETADGFRAARPEPVMLTLEARDAQNAQYDVTADGDILINQLRPQEPRPMTLVVNWRQRYKTPQ